MRYALIFQHAFSDEIEVATPKHVASKRAKFLFTKTFVSRNEHRD